MRITLNQKEIETAIELFITDQVTVPDDMDIHIDFKATRGEEGYQAFIDIVKHGAPTSDRSVDPRIQPVEGAENLGIVAKVEAAKQQAASPKRRGRPPGSLNKPKVAQAEPEKTTEATTVVEPEKELPQEAPVAADVNEEVVSHTEVKVDEPVAVTEENDPTPEPVQEQPVDYAAAVKASEQSLPKEDPIKEPEEKVEEPAPAAPTKSLFANLAKPVNTPAASE